MPKRVLIMLGGIAARGWPLDRRRLLRIPAVGMRCPPPQPGGDGAPRGPRHRHEVHADQPAAMRDAILILLFWMDACAPRPADQGDPARGEQRFAEIGCNGCHTVAGVGGMVGPDLTHVGSAPPRERGRWSSARAYIEESIRQPQATWYRAIRATCHRGRSWG
jgi:mono/diheme cytochrome c family protein